MSNANVYERLRATADRFAERTAVELQRAEGVDRCSYADLHRLAERAAAGLAARGIGCGDRCAVLAENGADWCAVVLGLLRIGAVAMPLDSNYSAAQIGRLLEDSGARIVVVAPRFGAVAEEAVRAVEGSRVAVAIPELLDAAPGQPPPAVAVVPADAPAALMYTSGTTSDPKGVVLTHGNLSGEIDAALAVIAVDDGDAVLGVLPLFHALALVANLLLPFAVGARVTFLETLTGAELMRALGERGITALCVVPQFFYLIHQRIFETVARTGWPRRATFGLLLRSVGALRERTGVNLGRLVFRRAHHAIGRHMRLLVSGGSRFDPGVGRDLFRMGFNILQAYGLTETSGAATALRPDDRHVGSVGQALPGIEIRIAPTEAVSEGDTVGGSPVGEVLIRGPVVMAGYHGRPAATAAVLRDGWFHSGDLGYLDAAGRLYVTGRAKEVIVLASGKNLYPEEIEAHYARSPFIKELCVFGRARAGEPAADRLHAIVVPDFDALRERGITNVAELLRFEIENRSIGLPPHKRILGYDIATEDLPRTTTRKLKRYEIERRAATGERPAGSERARAPERPEDERWRAEPHVRRALDIVREAAPAAAGVGPESSIELDLGLDSMERVELIASLEARFGVRVAEDAAARIFTVRELVEAVRPADGGAPEDDAEAGGWGRLLAENGEHESSLRRLLRPHRLRILAGFVAMRAFHAVARLLAGLRVAGREHLPRQGPFLLCPNHESFLDAFLLVSALPYRAFSRMFFVGASEYFATPLRARIAKVLNVVPVDPDSQLVRAMQASAAGLRKGKVLILFPEGERSIDGEVKRFRKGAAILALQLGVPVVPAALDGAFELWPRGRPFRWRKLRPFGRARARVAFGPPIPPPAEPSSEAGYTTFTERLRDAVVEIRRALRGG